MSLYRKYAMCWWCRHFIITPTNLGFHFSCSAFPQEIPEDIYDGDFDHREPYPNDNGVRFELASFDVLKERWIFQISDDPQELAGAIKDLFSIFDTYRAKGLLNPPMYPKSNDESV